MDASTAGTDAGPTPIADSGATDSAAPAPATGDAEFLFVVTGSLTGADEEAAGAAHDQLAAGGEEASKAAGDFGHDALLATSMLGHTPAGIEFLGLDRWNDLAAAQGFYAIPEVAEGFAAVFTQPPGIAAYARMDWHGWGDLDSADGADHWFVVVRGRLADEPAVVRPGHDQIAAGGEELAKGAGDVAHVVYLGADDQREFLAIDVWSDDANLEGFYANPDFQAGFAALFEGPPSLVVYRSTDWHQW